MPQGEFPVYRFREFEVDPYARTLKRAGARVSLSRRSFDLLLYFVQNSGKILSKEELLKKIWPDTFVDENSLTKSISVLRKALDQNPQGSTLVVTLAGRGYQFGAPVEVVCSGAETAREETGPESQDQAIGDVVQQRTMPTRIEESGQSRPRTTQLGWLAMGLGALAVLAAIGGGALLLWRHFHPAPQLTSVVLADFDNTTADKDFDFALKRAFQIELEQSPFVDILPQATVQETLAEMQRDADAALTPELAREICERKNGQAVLTGSISTFAGKYLLMVNANSCVSGKSLARYKAEVATKDDVLPALDVAATLVRKQLGESAASLEKFQAPIAQATTSSLEALRAYTQALAAQDRGDTISEMALFQHAIVLDPNFASAYRGLSLAYRNRQDLVQAKLLVQKAYDLRAHTTERERLAIEIAYSTYGTWDLESAIVNMQLYNQVYPNDASNWFSLSSMYSALGEYPQAIEAGEHGYRLAPDSGTGAEMLARAYMRANRFADAKRLATAEIAGGKDRWGAHRILFQIAYLEHDTARMNTEGKWGFTHQEMGQSLTDLGFVAASEGKFREATDDFTRARQEAIRSGDGDFADEATMFLAGIQEEFGYAREAAATLKRMMSDESDPGTTAAFKVELGDLGPAQREIARMENSDTRNTMSTYFDLPTLRALVDIKTKRPAKAVEDIEPARRYQMRDYGVPLMRARAEDEAGMLDKAAEDYRLVLANPGLDPIWPGHSYVLLDLARVLAKQNKFDEARAEYQEFLTIWRDADPQVPLLIQARQEFAKLQAH